MNDYTKRTIRRWWEQFYSMLEEIINGDDATESEREYAKNLLTLVKRKIEEYR